MNRGSHGERAREVVKPPWGSTLPPRKAIETATGIVRTSAAPTAARDKVHQRRRGALGGDCDASRAPALPRGPGPMGRAPRRAWCIIQRKPMHPFFWEHCLVTQGVAPLGAAWPGGGLVRKGGRGPLRNSPLEAAARMRYEADSPVPPRGNRSAA